MKKYILAAILPLTMFMAKGANPNVTDIRESITDNDIVFPSSFETDTRERIESWYLKNYTTTDDRYVSQRDPEVSEEEMKRRLEALPTVIDMPYNQIVREYILRYTGKSRAQIATLLGLSIYYMPIFEQVLEEKGLPLELKYLPVIESGLDPNAVSKHGATGLWQMMIGTAKGLGLEVTSVVDERRDPIASSEKAASYLKDLYESYGDWTLAIAAYNCGPTTVNKALRRAGGDPKSHSFWSIYPYLPAETRGYVPMFVAANYVMTYYPEHNISPVLATKPLVTDTITVDRRLHFNQVSEVLDIPVEEIRILNPQFRADVIPAVNDRSYYLVLPSQQIHAFLVSENDIYSHDADKYARLTEVELAEAGTPQDTPAPADNGNAAQEVAQNVAQAKAQEQAQEQEVAMVRESAARAEGKKEIVYTVKAGETLSSIADQFGVSVNEIKETNSLRRAAVRTGQQLKIMVPDDKALAANTPAPAKSDTAPAPRQEKKQQPAKQTAKTEKKKPAKPQVHTVKNGDSFARVASKYGVTVNELKKANPGIKSDVIHPGDKLTIPSKGKAANSGNAKSGKKRKRR